MRRALLLAALSPISVHAVDGEFDPVEIVVGTNNALRIDVCLDNRDGKGCLPHDVTRATGTLVVYRTPPNAGVGGPVLFTKTLTPAGAPTNSLVCIVTEADTAVPGGYYAEATLIEGSARRVLRGIVSIKGR